MAAYSSCDNVLFLRYSWESAFSVGYWVRVFLTHPTGTTDVHTLRYCTINDADFL